MAYGNNNYSDKAEKARRRAEKQKQIHAKYRTDAWVINGFNVGYYMTELEGDAPYLTTDGRLMLFRQAHPMGVVITTCIFHDRQAKQAEFRAEVYTRDPARGGSMIGRAHGSQSHAEFDGGYYEKAETVAIGRALDNAGFGLAYVEAIRNGLAPATPGFPSQEEYAGEAGALLDGGAPELELGEKQADLTDHENIKAKAKALGVPDGDVLKLMLNEFGAHGTSGLKKREVWKLIDEVLPDHAKNETSQAAKATA